MGTLMFVNIVFDYYADIVSVPDSIGINIKKYQNQCDKWLFNKLNEHEFWEKDDSGNKLGVGVCSESFIYWLNEFVLKDSKEKAYIVRKSINNYDESLPTIYYWWTEHIDNLCELFILLYKN